MAHLPRVFRAPCFLPAVLALGAGPALAQGPPSTVRTDPVQETRLQERRLVVGDVRAVRRARVASEEAGHAVELAVREGSRVERGELLVGLDAARLELELAVLEAERGVAEALVVERERGVEQERRDAQAVSALNERGAANAKELADARTALAEAEARLLQAQGELAVLAARAALLRQRIEDMRVRAPFPGTIARVETELGEWVEEGAAVVELVSDELEVWLQVPQRYLVALEGRGGALAVRVADDPRELACSRWRTVPVVDPVARMLTVIAELGTREEGAGPPAAPGMSATAWVPVAEETAHTTVAVDALARGESGPFVWVATPPAGGEEGAPWSVRVVGVEVLWREGGRAVVAGELRAGDRTVVEGQARLFPGASVVPVDAPGAGGPAPAGGAAGEATGGEGS